MEERSIYISSVDREKFGKSKTHDFKIKLQTTLKLDQNMKHEIAVDTVMMTYSWHNISESIKNSHNGGVNWETITFVDGMCCNRGTPSTKLNNNNNCTLFNVFFLRKRMRATQRDVTKRTKAPI